jgi:multiple sugar transport system substrate-binding protein
MIRSLAFAADAMRRRALGFASAAALCAATACTSAAHEQTVLKFWAMGREGEVVTELLPEFERSHPGIRVEVQQLPWTAAHEKLLTAFAGDAMPDLCQLGNTWIPEFTALGAIAPLDARLAVSESIRAADYFPGIWDTNVIAGRVYGVPWYVDTRLFFYRRDLLAEAGYTRPPGDWSEWARMLAAIKAEVGPDRYAVLLPLNEFEPLLALSLQQDEPLLRDNGRWGNFRSEGFKRALGFYVEMFRRAWAPPATNTQISNVWNELGRGYFSFYISGPWNIGEFKRRLPESQQATWATAPLPGPRGPGASIAGGSSLAVFAASRHKEAAWLLIEYLSQPAVQKRMHELTGDLPPRRSAWNDAALADDAYARAFRDQLERVKPTPKIPEWERIATEIRLVAEAAVHGDLSVEQAAAELDARADKILEKRRWLLARGAVQ